MNRRRQALSLCFDPAVDALIQIVNHLLFEVIHGIEFLKAEQFALKQPKEIFHRGIIQTLSLPAHALDNTIFSQLLLVLPVLILPALLGVQKGS